MPLFLGNLISNEKFFVPEDIFGLSSMNVLW